MQNSNCFSHRHHHSSAMSHSHPGFAFQPLCIHDTRLTAERMKCYCAYVPNVINFQDTYRAASDPARYAAELNRVRFYYRYSPLEIDTAWRGAHPEVSQLDIVEKGFLGDEWCADMLYWTNPLDWRYSWKFEMLYRADMLLLCTLTGISGSRMFDNGLQGGKGLPCRSVPEYALYKDYANKSKCIPWMGCIALRFQSLWERAFYTGVAKFDYRCREYDAAVPHLYMMAELLVACTLSQEDRDTLMRNLRDKMAPMRQLRDDYEAFKAVGGGVETVGYRDFEGRCAAMSHTIVLEDLCEPAFGAVVEKNVRAALNGTTTPLDKHCKYAFMTERLPILFPAYDTELAEIRTAADNYHAEREAAEAAANAAGACRQCGATPAHHVCGKCLTSLYCGRECQKRHWKEHHKAEKCCRKKCCS